MERTLNNLDETKQMAREVLNKLIAGMQEHAATVLALYGDLGSGKTTLTQMIAGELGVAEEITSPTFVIQKKYPLKNKAFECLVHIDAYRLDSPEELKVLDWGTTVGERGNLIIIEWADRVETLIPLYAHHVRLTFVDDGVRRISYTHG